MRAPDHAPELLRDFALLLTYPAASPAAVARRAQGRLRRRGAAAALGAFAERAERAGPFELEEAYSSTFDLEPACAPYVGHHLCGEGPQRGRFLARLADLYRRDGFAAGEPAGELPDHLSVVLRYLAATPGGEDREALLREGLLPALDRMLGALEDRENPYRAVLAALREEVA